MTFQLKDIDKKAAFAVLGASTLGALGGGKFTRSGLALLAAHDLFFHSDKKEKYKDKQLRAGADLAILAESGMYFYQVVKRSIDAEVAPLSLLNQTPKTVAETRAGFAGGCDYLNNHIRVKSGLPQHVVEFTTNHEMSHLKFARFVGNTFGRKSLFNSLLNYKTLTGYLWAEMWTEFRSGNLISRVASNRVLSAMHVGAYGVLFAGIAYLTQYQLFERLFKKHIIDEV